MEWYEHGPPRLLRIYRRLAQEIHDCDNCGKFIFPGEEYQGKVFVTWFRSGKRIVVHKEHLDCPYDPGLDLEKEFEESLCKSDDVPVDEAWPLAA